MSKTDNKLASTVEKLISSVCCLNLCVCVRVCEIDFTCSTCSNNSPTVTMKVTDLKETQPC